DDLVLIGDLYQQVVRTGVVGQASRLPDEARPVFVDPVVRQLETSVCDLDRAAADSSPAIAETVRSIRDSLREAITVLTGPSITPFEDEWPEGPVQGPASRQLLATLVLNGLRLAETDNLFARADMCQEVADNVLRVIMLDTLRGDTSTASRF